MRHGSIGAVSVLGVLALALPGCSTGLWGNRSQPELRATNVELQVVSQSCFQGEAVPCG